MTEGTRPRPIDTDADRLPYEPPCIEDLGSIEQLTLGPFGGSSDGNTTGVNPE